VFTRYFLGRPDSIDGVISESKYLLDDSNAAKEQMDVVKKQLKLLLRPGYEIPSILLAQSGWPEKMAQPHIILQEVSAIMARLRTVMRLNWATKEVDQIQRRWCCFESPNLFKERWEKMFNNFCATERNDSSDSDFKKEVNCPDPSGIPELYDSLKYDALHNRRFLEVIFSDPETSSAPTPTEDSYSTSETCSHRSGEDYEPCNTDLRNLYAYVRVLFNFVAPQEYGISEKEKKTIGMLIGLPLLKSILRDLEDFRESDNPKTRLYFTKGTLMNECEPFVDTNITYFYKRITCTCSVKSRLSIWSTNQIPSLSFTRVRL
jgi:inositol hexakisphosphate/diphosphoinositol-pentakisphosphate kinase